MPTIVQPLPVQTFDSLEEALAYTVEASRGRSLQRSYNFDDGGTVLSYSTQRSRSAGGSGSLRSRICGRSQSPASRKQSSRSVSPAPMRFASSSRSVGSRSGSPAAMKRPSSSRSIGSRSQSPGPRRISDYTALSFDASPKMPRRTYSRSPSSRSVASRSKSPVSGRRGSTSSTTKRERRGSNASVSSRSTNASGRKKKRSNKPKRMSSDDDSRRSVRSMDPNNSSPRRGRKSFVATNAAGILSSAPPPPHTPDTASIGFSNHRSAGSSFLSDSDDDDSCFDVESQKQEYYEKVEPKEPSCCWRYRRCYCVGVMCLLLAGATIFLLFFFSVLETQAFENNLVKQWIDNDPWADVDKTYTWPKTQVDDGDEEETVMDGRIVKLEIWNTMGEQWQSALELAVANWQDADQTISSSNVLDLTLVEKPSDPECKPETGVIKICNANYGPTGWRGSNQLVLGNAKCNIIDASAAKINDFYFDEAEDNFYVRLYTICHEIGHALGLPHWDVDSFNRNDGNCMDYTETDFKGNARPDVTNFLFLENLYDAN